MNTNLKPYPEYKDSGTPWLGQVPKNWTIERNKYFIREISERSTDGAEDLLTVSQYTGVTKRKDRMSESGELLTNAATLEGYKRAKKNDLVVNIMLAWNGSLGISPVDGIVSPAYCVYRLNAEKVTPKYIHYLFKTPIFTGLFKTVSTGVIDSRLRLYPDVFFRLLTILPPKDEQLQISRFLDYKSAQIAKFIKARRRMIELLKEKKQAIINDAVTGKIDVTTGKPYPKYKPSGVEWLGDVPEHWGISPIKRATQFVKTGTTPKGVDEKYFSDDGFDWYTPGDFGENKFLSRAARKLSILGKSEVNIFPKNTVFMIGIGATIGKAAISSQEETSCNQQINALIPNSKINSEYLTLCIRTMRHFIIECGKYTTMPILNQDETRRLQLPLPVLDDQELVIAFISKETEQIDLAVSRYQVAIELMLEYRTRLIADVVTGKVDVRNIPVPEFEEETVEELSEESDEVLETEEAIDEAE